MVLNTRGWKKQNNGFVYKHEETPPNEMTRTVNNQIKFVSFVLFEGPIISTRT